MIYMIAQGEWINLADISHMTVTKQGKVRLTLAGQALTKHIVPDNMQDFLHHWGSYARTSRIGFIREETKCNEYYEETVRPKEEAAAKERIAAAVAKQMKEAAEKAQAVAELKDQHEAAGDVVTEMPSEKVGEMEEIPDGTPAEKAKIMQNTPLLEGHCAICNGTDCHHLALAAEESGEAKAKLEVASTPKEDVVSDELRAAAETTKIEGTE